MCAAASRSNSSRLTKKPRLSPEDRKDAYEELEQKFQELSLGEKKMIAILAFERTLQRTGYKTKGYAAGAEAVGVTARAVANWVDDFETNGEFTDSLRGRHAKSVWILNDPWAGDMFDEHIRENSRRKHQPNLTAEDQAQWVTTWLVPTLRKRVVDGECDTFTLEEIPKLTVSTSAVRVWMKRRGFRFCRKKKGVYVDGHEREDVVADRKDIYLPRMKAIASRGPIVTPENVTWPPECDLNGDPKQDVGDLYDVTAHSTPVLTVVHDESNYSANDEQPQQWVADGDTVCISYFSSLFTEKVVSEYFSQILFLALKVLTKDFLFLNDGTFRLLDFIL